jgi:hypothetical protein
MLTQKELRELLHYDPNTGLFTWKVSRTNRIKVGDIAGYTHKNRKYVLIRIGKTLYEAHRLVWLYVTGSWPKELIDHKNGIEWDNRLTNLREATRLQNNRNAKPNKNTSSEYKGVQKRGKYRFRAKIQNKGVGEHLGYFCCEHEAALVYNQRAEQLHGAFAWFNQVYNKFDVDVGLDN